MSKSTAVPNRAFNMAPPKLIRPRRGSNFGKICLRVCSLVSKVVNKVSINFSSELKVNSCFLSSTVNNWTAHVYKCSALHLSAFGTLSRLCTTDFPTQIYKYIVHLLHNILILVIQCYMFRFNELSSVIILLRSSVITLLRTIIRRYFTTSQICKVMPKL